MTNLERVVIFGSASLFASFPDIDTCCKPIESSLDADFILTPAEEKTAKMILDAIGVRSVFFQVKGYYADVVSPGLADTFPGKWEERLVPFPGFDRVYALHPLDLALVKLLIARPKDWALLEAIIGQKLVSLADIRNHFQTALLGEREATTIGLNLHELAKKVSGQ
ncbi:MAG: DUF6036 family nucleotidyltransferase [Verrucomicrobiae bacterium]|nr:DUF6036 family nucleotidyltransferase [Verrucomicrobiae bacterium]